MKTYQFIMTIEVQDEGALRAAALAHFVEEHPDRPIDRVIEEWKELRNDPCNDPIAADLQELFDPGKSPPGTSIQCSSAKCLSERDG